MNREIIHLPKTTKAYIDVSVSLLSLTSWQSSLKIAIFSGMLSWNRTNKNSINLILISLIPSKVKFGRPVILPKKLTTQKIRIISGWRTRVNFTLILWTRVKYLCFTFVLKILPGKNKILATCSVQPYPSGKKTFYISKSIQVYHTLGFSNPEAPIIRVQRKLGNEQQR